MASSNELIRDPKTGRYMSKLQSMSYRANLAVKQHGLSMDEKELVAHQNQTGIDSQIVKSYIVPMADFIHNWDGDLAELRKIIPAIEQLNAVAQKDDPVISAAEKRRVDETAKFLIAYVRKKTGLTTRIASTLKNVARSGINKARSGMSDKLATSDNLLVQLAAKALSPGRDKKAQADREVLKAKADALQQIAQRISSGSTSNAPRHLMDEDEDEPAAPRRTPKKAKPQHVSKGAPVADMAGPLDEILVVDRAILHQVEVTNQLLRTGAESNIRNKEADNRAADENTTKGPASNSPVRVKNAKSAGAGGMMGMLSGVLGAVSHAFTGLLDLVTGKGGLTTLIKNLLPTVKTLFPALKMLGTGALAVGAAVVGFKAADWVRQMLGLGSSAEDLKNLLDQSQESWKDSLHAIKRFAVDVATTGHTPAQNETQAAKKDLVQRAQQAGMQSNLQWHEGWSNDEIANQATAYLKSHPTLGKDKPTGPKAPEFHRVLGKPKLPLDTTRLPPTGALAPNLTGQSFPAASLSPIKVPMAATSHLSEDGLKRLKQREGAKPATEPYWDVNGWAIGYGDHFYKGKSLGNDPKQKPSVRLSVADADLMLRQRAGHFEDIVRKNLGGKMVSQSQFDSLVSVAYNSEVAAAKLARRAAAGESLTQKDFLASGTVHGVRDKGLQARRAGEYAQFSSGRAAAPIVSLTAATAGGVGAGGGSVIFAPSTVVSKPGGAGQAPPPVALTTTNPDPTVQALRSVNSI